MAWRRMAHIRFVCVEVTMISIDQLTIHRFYYHIFPTQYSVLLLFSIGFYPQLSEYWFFH